MVAFLDIDTPEALRLKEGFGAFQCCAFVDSGGVLEQYAQPEYAPIIDVRAGAFENRQCWETVDEYPNRIGLLQGGVAVFCQEMIKTPGRTKILSSSA